VSIYGGTGSVVNAGSIIGQTYDGVYMDTNGSVNNLTGGTITGGAHADANGVTIHGTGSVVNAGSIASTSTNGVGVGLGAGGSVENRWGGTISGNAAGVAIVGGTGTVINRGTIVGTNSDGVNMNAGGSVHNQWLGSIEGGQYGVQISGGAGYVTNLGSISGEGRDGVRLRSGGTVWNQFLFGDIFGNTNGVYITGAAGTVINNGTIIGTNNDGVLLGNGGSVYNRWLGSIEGGQYGVEITGGAAFVTNAGTIIGDNGTAISLGNYSNTVVLRTGSDVEGNIVGGTNFDAAILQGDGSYGNSFSNFETLTVQGNETGWNLTGTNTFSTNTTVQTGLLSINDGSLTTPVLTVSNGAILGGAGTIYGAVTNSGGISPGTNSSGTSFIGKLTIVGTLNLMTNSIYYDQVNAATNSDLIVVNGGTATIGSNATVNVLPVHEIYGSNIVYTILTATNGVVGTNASVSITALFLTPSLQYHGTNVTLNLAREKFTTVANTYNQNSVAGALDGIVDSPGAGMSNLVNEFFWLGSAAEARQALDSMSGEIHGSLGMLDVQQQDAFNRSVSLRTGRISAGGENGGYALAKPLQLADAGSTPLPVQSDANDLLDNIWLQGFGSFGHLDGDGNASGGSFTISGVNGGFDYRLSPEVLVGLAVGYSHDDATVGGPGANGKVDAIQFAGYGGYVNGPWHLDGILSYGFLQTDTKRFINVGSIHQEADANYNGGVFSLSTEGGYVFKFDWLTVEPTLGLKYSHLWQDGFQETGTASDGHNYGLNVNDVGMDSFRTALGVRLAAQLGKEDGVQFIPELRAGWEHEFVDKTADVNARFIGGSGDFNVRGVELGADSGVLGAGLTVAFNKAIRGFVNYDANLNARMSSHAISGGLSYTW
jgi:outer membrane autotransporter protein